MNLSRLEAAELLLRGLEAGAKLPLVKHLQPLLLHQIGARGPLDTEFCRQIFKTILRWLKMCIGCLIKLGIGRKCAIVSLSAGTLQLLWLRWRHVSQPPRVCNCQIRTRTGLCNLARVSLLLARRCAWTATTGIVVDLLARLAANPSRIRGACCGAAVSVVRIEGRVLTFGRGFCWRRLEIGTACMSGLRVCGKRVSQKRVDRGNDVAVA